MLCHHIFVCLFVCLCLLVAHAVRPRPPALWPRLPKDAHGGVGGELHVGLVHEHGLEAGVGVAAGQDLLVELKDLVQEGHGVLEQGQQLGQAEVGHLQGGGGEGETCGEVSTFCKGHFFAMTFTVIHTNSFSYPINICQ